MDVIELLTEDHRRVRELIDRIVSTDDGEGSPEVAELMKELAVHAGVEELIVYPRACEKVPVGYHMTEEHLKEHQRVKDLLAALEHAGKYDKRLALATLDTYLRAHVEKEEHKLFPAMRRHMSAEELEKLGEAVAKAKKVAPTHAHPHAPRRPPGNIFADGAAAIVDRIRDKIAG